MHSLSLVIVSLLAVAFSATSVLAVPVPAPVGQVNEPWGSEARPAKSEGGGVIVPYESKA